MFQDLGKKWENLPGFSFQSSLRALIPGFCIWDQTSQSFLGILGIGRILHLMMGSKSQFCWDFYVFLLLQHLISLSFSKGKAGSVVCPPWGQHSCMATLWWLQQPSVFIPKIIHQHAGILEFECVFSSEFILGLSQIYWMNKLRGFFIWWQHFQESIPGARNEQCR